MTRRYPFSPTLVLVLYFSGLCFSAFGTPAFPSRFDLLLPVSPPLFYVELEALSQVGAQQEDFPALTTRRQSPFVHAGPEALTSVKNRSVKDRQEDFPALTARLQQRLLMGQNIDQDLGGMLEEELYRYRDYLMGRVASDPDFDAWEAHYQWQSLAALVYHIDADAYRTQLEKRAVHLAERYFTRAGQALQKEPAGLPRHFRALTLDAYKTLIVSPPGVTDVCAAYLRDIEHALKRMEVDQLRELVRNEHDVIFDRIEKRRKKASQWLAERVNKDKRFRHSRGVYTYVSAMEGENRKWLVELDTVFPGAGYDGFLTFRSKRDANVATTIRSDDFADMVATGAIDSLLRAATEQQAYENTASSHEGDLFQYDLPEEGHSAYLRFLPRSYGSAEFGFLLSSFVRSAALSHRYGARVSRTEIIFTNALEDSLASVLKRIKDQDISSVIVEFASHGVQNGFRYGEKPLSPEAITHLIVAHPEVKFLIRTPACYGGKLRDALLAETGQDGSLRSRVAFFAQSKPDNPNILYYGAALDASVYDVFLLQNLLDAEIKSYGEAAERAGRMTRRVYWTHAEAVYQGRLMQ